MNRFLKGLFFASLLAVLLAAYALLQVALDAGSVKDVVRLIAAFGCFGFLLGGIYAFDKESAIREKESASARVGIGFASGVMLALLFQWPIEGYLLSALVGAGLGYFGMIWAKYINF
jgi:cytochrome b561